MDWNCFLLGKLSRMIRKNHANTRLFIESPHCFRCRHLFSEKQQRYLKQSLGVENDMVKGITTNL